MYANAEATDEKVNKVTPRPWTHLDIVQDDASAPLVLEGQEFLSVLALLVAVLLEEVREAVEGHVIPGEVERLQEGTQRKQWLKGRAAVIMRRLQVANNLF